MILLELHYNCLGDGRPAVLLHGLFGCGKNLSGIARSLADRGFRVYLPDLRNHGRSPHNDNMSYPLMSLDIHHFLQQHNIQAPLLLGHSMGGKVAMTIALMNQASCERLVILDVAPVHYAHTFNTIIRALLDIDLSSVKNRRDAEEKLASALEPAALRQFLLQNLVREDDQYTWRLNLPAIKKSITQISNFPTMANKTFSRPALFLGGEQSDYLLPDHRQIIKDYFPQAGIEHIPHAGHWLHTEAPEATWAAIKAFLD